MSSARPTRPFSGIICLLYACVCFQAAVLFTWSSGQSPAALSALVPVVTALTWFIALPTAAILRRLRECVAGGGAGVLCSIVLSVIAFTR